MEIGTSHKQEGGQQQPDPQTRRTVAGPDRQKRGTVAAPDPQTRGTVAAPGPAAPARSPLRTPGRQCEPTLVTPCSVSTPGCKMPQPKLVPASGCTGPCGSACSCCHRATTHCSPPPAGPWAAPAPQRVPRCQGKRFLFFFVIKRLSRKLSADPKRM